MKLLDCSLRDGAHVNDGNFGKEAIREIVEFVLIAGTDLVEIGWIMDGDFKSHQSKWSRIQDAYEILPAGAVSPERLGLMLRVDWIARDSLPRDASRVGFIRIAFRQSDYQTAIRYSQILIDFGFLVFLNPVDTPAYSDSDLSRLLNDASDIKLAGFTLVDTYGVLTPRTLASKLEIFANEMPYSTAIGLHLHENLASGMMLAQEALTLLPNRTLIIDGTLRGIGRAPGNVPIEVLANHLNSERAGQYDINPLIQVLEKWIAPMFPDVPWGYDPAYFLSSVHATDRTFAEYLTNEGGASLSELAFVLKDLSYRSIRDFSSQEALDSLQRLRQNARHK